MIVSNIHLFSIDYVKEIDIRNLKKFMSESWHDTYDNSLGKEIVSNTTDKWHSEKSLTAQLKNDPETFLIATSNENIIGHIYANYMKVNEVYISRLYVASDWKRKGIGASLMSRIFKATEGCKNYHVEVELLNSPAIAFYKYIGFIEKSVMQSDLGELIKMEMYL